MREVLVARLVEQRREVDAEEVAVVPEMQLRLLLLVQAEVRVRREHDRAGRRKHESAGLQEPIPCDYVAFEHAFVDEQEADGLRNNRVHLLGQFNLLDFAIFVKVKCRITK